MTTKVSVQHVDGMRFLASTEDNAVVVDAAREGGGGGTALNAPQMFAAAVGACMCEFVANSCRLRDIVFDHLSVEIHYEALEKPRRVGALTATLHVQPPVPDDVKRRLVGVARHATLLGTLRHPPEIDIRFASDHESHE
ncbi:MAG TPA: OsmC family peroxiredoxin [Chloroflexi bacterium]|nr:OsmC family peroxiredoxin [Chloroflexota bacterium]